MRFKNKLILEKYLLTKGYFTGRSLITQIRTGTNKLEIEKGRHFRKEKEGKVGKEVKDRVCKQGCNNEVEDEEHFIVKCPRYNLLRSQLFDKIHALSGGKWNLEALSGDDQFHLIMGGTSDKHEMACHAEVQGYLIRAFRLRDSTVVM